MAALNWKSLFGFCWILLLVDHSSSFPVVGPIADMQPQTVCFYVVVSKAILLCFLDTSTTLAPQTVSQRWSHLKGVTKSSSALSGELKKERRWESFLWVLPVCAILHLLIVLPPHCFQLCFDYQFDSAEEPHKISCHCGAPECRKWINWGRTKIHENDKSKHIPCYSV